MKTTTKTIRIVSKIVINFFLVFAVLSFKQLVAQPAINSFAPLSGPAGTVVTITGNNFSAIAANNIVYFGAAKAVVSAATAVSISVIVPAGATFEPISVLNTATALTGFSSLPFMLSFNGGNNGFLPNSFAAKFALPGIDYTFYFNAIADIDGDGKTDILLLDDALNAVSVLRNTSTAGNLSFDAKLNFTTVISPQTIAVGDVDGDGRPDIVTTSEESNIFSVHKNTSTPGNISFATKVDFIGESDADKVHIADMDGDGKPDISFIGSYAVYVYKNISTDNFISFVKKIIMGTYDNISDLDLGDLDGDGKPEIVLANYGGPFGGIGGLIIYKNNSTRDSMMFQQLQEITTGGYLYSVEIGDLNGDQKPDIAVADGQIIAADHPVYILKNNSGGGVISFSIEIQYSTSSTRGDVSISDLDGDAKPDLSIVNGLPVSVFGNTSTTSVLSFAPKVNYDAGGPNICVGDMNGDAKPDLIIGKYVLINRVAYPYINSFTPKATGTAGSSIQIIGHNFNGTVSVAFGGTPAASFTVVSDSVINAITGNGSTGSVTVTTVVGTDSLAGFTFSNEPSIFSFSPLIAGTGDTVTIHGINFQGTTSVQFGGIEASSFIVNADTLIHAVVGIGTSGNISVTTNKGTGTIDGFSFKDFPIVRLFAPAAANTGTKIVIKGENFNPDLDKNIVFFGAVRAQVEQAKENQLKVKVPTGSTYKPLSVLNKANGLTGYSPLNFNATYLNGGANFTSKSFSSPVNLKVKTDQFCVSDINLDGRPDIIYLDNLANKVFVSANRSHNDTIDFSAGKFFKTGAAPASVAAADLNGDGKPDMVVTNSNNYSLSIFRNTSKESGVISFAAKTDIPAAYQVNRVAIADMDLDGKPDIVVTNEKNISFFKNTSSKDSISFLPRIDISSNLYGGSYVSYPHALALADLDKDGKPEIILANDYKYSTTSNHYYNLSVFLNTSQNGVFGYATQKDYYSDDLRSINIGDLDGDQLTDIVSGTYVFPNKSTPGQISLEPYKSINGFYSNLSAISDLDGDGKPDITIPNEYGVLLIKNISSKGLISFENFVQDTSDFYSTQIDICDFNGDGRNDLLLGGIYTPLHILSNMIIPSAIFNVSAKVAYTGNTINFTDKSAKVTSWRWDFDGDGTFDSKEQNPSFTYTLAGHYNARLRINNDPGLETTQAITILPDKGTPYTLADGGDFETNPFDFAADNIGDSYFSKGISVQTGKDSTNSGLNAWVLDIDQPTYSDLATAYLYTPSFNCTALGNYTLSFFTKYGLDNKRDGFRIEYSTDKGLSWQPFGNEVQSNWYDYISNGSVFPVGDAIFSTKNATKYVKKTFTSSVPGGHASVAFRIIFKSGYHKTEAGVAIDDFTLEGPANLPIPLTVIAATNSNSSKENTKIIIAGNITQSYINILTPLALLHKQLSASIINSSGAIVQTFNITNASTIIPVNKLGTGFYFVKFMQSGLVIQEEKFIKH